MIMSTEINNDLLVAIIGVLSALLVAMITFIGVWYQLKKTEVNTLKAKLRDKQEIVYDKIYSYIFDLLNDTINKTPIDKAKYANRYMEIKKLLLFHASDRVVLQFIKLNIDTGRNDSILTLRNEIGYKGGKVNEKSILQIRKNTKVFVNSLITKILSYILLEIKYFINFAFRNRTQDTN